MLHNTRNTAKLLLDNGINDNVLISLYKLEAFDLAMMKAICSDKVRILLDSAELQPFWENKFNRLRIVNEPGFQFRNPEPQSTADFYCGYVLYLAALKQKQMGREEHYEEYLQLSLSTFNSFYAIQEIVLSLIKACKDSHTNAEALYKFIISQNSQIEQFKTPGYLLLANAYFYLAEFYQEEDLKLVSVGCYKTCWEKLYMAGLLEENSEREIHNAYFGHGLAASNVLGLNSINQIKDNCLKIASQALPYPVRISIERAADGKIKDESKAKVQEQDKCELDHLKQLSI